MRARRLLLPVLAGCAAVTIATPATAMPPDRFSFSDSGSEPGFIKCDGFAIDLEGTFSTQGTVFFDQAGEVVRVIQRSRVTETYTNSVTGKTLVNHGVFQDSFTRIEGTDEFRHTVVGYDFRAPAPGQGLVLADIGRKVYAPDGEHFVFEAGRHDMPQGPAVEAIFCAALS
jgi:hypothetical protein